jgi:hypothetical protein
MPVYTTARTGNWSDASTWTGGVAPSTGDNVAIAHNVTLDVDAIVGDSSGTGIDGTLALKTNSSVTLTIAAGVKLTLRGHARNDGNVNVGAGVHVLFETPSPSTNWLWTNAARADENRRITFAGTSGSRVRVESKAGGGRGRFRFADDAPSSGSMHAEYTDFVRIGEADDPLDAIRVANAPCYFRLDNCRLLSCGKIRVNGHMYVWAPPTPTDFGTVKLTNVQTIDGIGYDTGYGRLVDLFFSFYPEGGIVETPANVGFDGCDFQRWFYVTNKPGNWPIANTVFRAGQQGNGAPYAVSPAAAPAPWPYRAVSLTGPSGGGIGAASSNFTVALVGLGTCTGTTGDITVTPSDGGGGTFSPTTVTLNDVNTSATFTYTPATSGTKTISLGTSAGLLVDRSLDYIAANTATAYELIGPEAGVYVAGRAVSCTVRLPNGTSVPSPVTITPSADMGDTFAPTTVTLSTGTPEATFTYTPAVSGAKTLSTTNNGGLTNPLPVNLTARRSYAEVKSAWEAWVANPNPSSAYGAAHYANVGARPNALLGFETHNHYDPLQVFLSQKEYSGSSAFDAAIEAARYQWAELAVLPRDGGVTGWRRQIVGLVRDWERNGEEISLRAAAAMSSIGRASGGGASPIDVFYSDTGIEARENALQLSTHLNGMRIGVTEPVENATGMTATKLLAEYAMANCDRWALAAAHPFDPGDPISYDVETAIQPFIAGIVLRHLIQYYEATGDSRCPAKIKLALDSVWDACWYPEEEAFPYYDRDRHTGGYVDNYEEAGQPIVDGVSWVLSMYLAPAYAWYAKHATDPAEKETYRRRFEDIFRGACPDRLPGQYGLSTPKQYNQQLWWAVEGVRWHEQSITPLPAATTYTMTARVASCRANELGIQLVVALPANTGTAGPVTITPSDGGAGGTFVPASIVVHADEPIGVFRYAPAAAMAGQSITVSATNNGGLTNPANVTVSATTVAPLATGITVSAPAYQATKVGWHGPMTVSYSPPGAVAPRSVDYLGGFSRAIGRMTVPSLPSGYTEYCYEGYGNFGNFRAPSGTTIGPDAPTFPLYASMEVASRWHPNEPGLLVKVLHSGFESSPAAITAAARATALTITGPSTANVGEPATFTVTPNGPVEVVGQALNPDTGLPMFDSLSRPLMASYPATVTPSVGGAGGAFAPTTLTWNGLNDPKVLAYTPPAEGTYSITLSNNASPAVANPGAKTLTVGAAAATATTYTLTGPSSGTVNVSSTDFTVVPVGGVFTGTITPSDGGEGGTFSPASLTWSATSDAKTFTYTPTTVGARTIATTNSGGLANPAGIAYAATPTAATSMTFTGPTVLVVGQPETYTLAPDGAYSGSVALSSDHGGVFTPPSLSWGGASTAKTFTYAATERAQVVLTATPSGLPAPPSITAFGVIRPATYTMSAPDTLQVGQAATLTFSFPPATDPFGTTVITPWVSSGAGTFSPASVSLSVDQMSASLAYTPTRAGMHTISAANDQGLADPPELSRTISSSSRPKGRGYVRPLRSRHA